MGLGLGLAVTNLSRVLLRDRDRDLDLEPDPGNGLDGADGVAGSKNVSAIGQLSSSRRGSSQYAGLDMSLLERTSLAPRFTAGEGDALLPFLYIYGLRYGYLSDNVSIQS
jgi:hypothetical protein